MNISVLFLFALTLCLVTILNAGGNNEHYSSSASSESSASDSSSSDSYSSESSSHDSSSSHSSYSEDDDDDNYSKNQHLVSNVISRDKRSVCPRCCIASFKRGRHNCRCPNICRWTRRRGYMCPKRC